MIMAEEKMRERVPDRNHRENNIDSSDRRNFQTTNIRIGSVDPTTPSQSLTRRKKFQRSGDLKTLRICIVYDTRKETTQQQMSASSLIGTQEKEKKDKEEDNQKKDEDNPEDKGFQQSKRTVTVIFSRVLGSRSKDQDKLALRSIMVAEPAVPRSNYSGDDSHRGPDRWSS
jgi:hypothetical protein